MACAHADGIDDKGGLHLLGIVTEGKIVLVSLHTSQGMTRWGTTGDVIDGFRINAIDPVHNAVILVDATGSQQHLTLEKLKSDGSEILKPKVGHRSLLSLNELDWAWIKSSENPMRKYPKTIPAWASAYRNWTNLSEDIKTDIRNYYRTHGWDIEVTVINPDVVHIHNIRLVDPNASPPPKVKEGFMAASAILNKN